MAQDARLDAIAPDLVAARAAQAPQAIAVVAGRRQLTYAQLDRRANRLARRLREAGVGRDDVVGICLNRSIELVVAALAILKAGAGYLPLDPAVPGDRIAFMLDDCAAPFLITSPQHAIRKHRLHAACRVIELDESAECLGEGDGSPPTHDSGARQLAYVVYTSGSSGTPKGVRIRHDSLMNLVNWHQRAFAVTAADRATQIACPAFDAAVWELWPYLTAGASVHIPDDETRTDLSRFRDWLIAQGITISFVPTPMAELLLSLDWPRAAALRILLTGGDRLHRYPPPGLPFMLVNNYGPSEAAVVSTSTPVLPATAGAAPGLPPIGAAISGVALYVLDEQGQSVPSGMIGELHIGGRGVAAGYVNRPQLTSERFLDDPFVDEPGATMYRTGDLVRRQADGRLDFVGRVDGQVKIRGFRIELGEIEAVLAAHRAVEQAAVVAREDRPGDKRLVAYVVASSASAGLRKELVDHLAARLPEYMVPSSIVLLPALPMTPNGKVDRTLLPAPSRERAEPSMANPPQTPIEKGVAEIVASLLQLDDVDPEENFFLLGGHSLLGAQLLVRVREAFGVELPLRVLFDVPTISGLAAEIERRRRTGTAATTEAPLERLLA